MDFLDMPEYENNIVDADTFMWDGELDELREGEFNLDEWLSRSKADTQSP